MEAKRRIVNFRSFLIISVSVIVAVLGARFAFMSATAGFILLFLLFAVLVGLAILYIRRDTPFYKRITFLLAIILSIAAVVNFYFTVKGPTYADESVIHIVSGKADVIDFYDGTVVLKDITVDGLKEKGKIRLSVDFESFQELYALRIGDIMIFETYLKPNPILDEGNKMNAYAFRSGIKYRCYEFVTASESNDATIVLEKSQPDFFQNVKLNIYDMLILAMGSEHGSVAYGMFAGDTANIDDELSSAYSASGMAHTLSVSGLHVGFLSAALLFIFKLLRLRRLPSNLITILVLWFYAFFTGFMPAVLRAVIMATIMIAARILQRRYDPLSSLCAAVTVILVVFPVYLFEIGFQLSITAVFGIILFAKRITNFLRKIYIPKYIAQSLGVTASAQIGFLPAMIFGFHGIQMYALFINLLLLPIIGFAFSLMLIGILLTALFRPLIFVLKFVGILMSLINTVILSAAKLPMAVLYVVPTFGAVIFVSYILFFFASRFFIRPKRKWRVLNTALAFIFSAALCLSGIFTAPRYKSEAYIAPAQSFGDVTSVVRNNGRTYLIGDFKNFYAVDDALTALRINRVDAIFLTALNAEAARSVMRFSYSYSTGKIFAYEKSDLSGIKLLADAGITNFYTFDGTLTLANDVAPIVEDGKLLGYELLTNAGSIVFCGYRTNYDKIPLHIMNRTYAIRCFMFLDLYPDRIFLTNMERGFKSTDIPKYQFTLQNENEFLFDFSTGKVFQFPA